MTALQQLETFNVLVAELAAGDSHRYDALMAERAEEARRLISAARAELPIAAKHTKHAGAYHYINGIEARLPRLDGCSR
jgi:phytoene/squalene synthetase